MVNALLYACSQFDLAAGLLRPIPTSGASLHRVRRPQADDQHQQNQNADDIRDNVEERILTGHLIGF